MPKMKEVNTPFKFFGIKYFKDETGIYYKKIGDNHRKQVRPFWKKKRIRLGIPLLFILILGFVGYKIGMNLASEKVVNELSAQIPEKDIQDLLKDPSIQDMIEKEIGADKKQKMLEKYAVTSTIANQVNINKDTQELTTDTNNTSAVNQKPAAGSKDASQTDQQTPEKTKPKLTFKTRDEVLKFLLSKFSMSELTELAKKAEGGITPEEKAEINAIVSQRLSSEEYGAVKVFAVIELSKQNQ